MGDTSGMPPMGMNSGMPPMGATSGMPPMGMNSGMPQMGDTSGMPGGPGDMNGGPGGFVPPPMPPEVERCSKMPPGPDQSRCFDELPCDLGGPPPGMALAEHQERVGQCEEGKRLRGVTPSGTGGMPPMGDTSGMPGGPSGMPGGQDGNPRP